VSSPKTPRLLHAACLEPFGEVHWWFKRERISSIVSVVQEGVEVETLKHVFVLQPTEIESKTLIGGAEISKSSSTSCWVDGLGLLLGSRGIRGWCRV
jgi:hypothetical protein